MKPDQLCICVRIIMKLKLSNLSLAQAPYLAFSIAVIHFSMNFVRHGLIFDL